MFTIKFYSFFEGESNIEVVVSAPHYEVYTHTSGVKTITVYKDHMGVDGVDRKILSNELADRLDYKEDYFHVCYVENSSGKTIAKISSK